MKQALDENTVFEYLFGACIVGVVLFYLAVFFPGYFTNDSVYILDMATGREPLSGWHPIFVVELWSVLLAVLGNPQLLWPAQLAVFLFAVSMLAKQFGRASSIVFLLTALWPPIFTNMGALWKDDWAMTASILLLVATMSALKRPGAGRLAVVGAIAALCTLLRVDYFAIAAPFLFMTMWAAFRQRENAWVSTCGILSFTTILIGLTIAMPVPQKVVHPWVPLVAWDIVGVSVMSGTPVTLGEHQYPAMKSVYNCSTSDPLVFAAGALPANIPQGEAVMAPQKEVDAYIAAWVDALENSPVSWLRHRLCIARQFFGVETEDVHYPYPFGSVSNPYVGLYVRSPANILVYWFFDRNAHGLLWRYWVYLLASIILTITVVVRGSHVFLASTIFLSIIGCAARVVVLPATDFRYGLWIVLATIVLAAILIQDLLQQHYRLRKDH